MAYGYRSRYRKSSSASAGRRRFGSNSSTKVAFRKKTTRYGSRMKPRFALAGYARNTEKKYFDKTYISNSNEQLTGSTTANDSNGVTYISNEWGNYTFGIQAAQAEVSNDMLKGVATGTTARTRIGNKVKLSYLKGAFTFTAAATTGQSTQNGETVEGDPDGVGGEYLRTTYRFVIVKDMQVNSTDVNITWQQVFDTTNQQAGVHSELNVDNMGRFIVLEDKIFTVDADSPQKTLPFTISGSKLGSIRYNGPGAAALTDKGCYVVWSAYVMGWRNIAARIGLPSPVGHSRMCFTDD